MQLQLKALLPISMLSFSLVACGGETTSDIEDESQLVAKIEGRFETTAPAATRFRAGYLYGIEIAKPYNGVRNAVIYVVSDACSKASVDKTCDRAFIEKSGNTLDRANGKLTVRNKNISGTYDIGDTEGDAENVKTVSVSWDYGVTATGLELKPKGAANSFTVGRLATTKISSKVKADLTSWLGDGGLSDLSEEVQNAPIAARREAYYYQMEHGYDYETTILTVTVAGKEYAIVNETSDGADTGVFVFFASDGKRIGSVSWADQGDGDSFSWAE